MAFFVGLPEKTGRRSADRQITDEINDQEAGDKHMSIAMSAPGMSVTPVTCEKRLPAVPCHIGDPDLWFAESPAELERAKALCADCPIRTACLAAALERQEPWGVGRRDHRPRHHRGAQAAAWASAEEHRRQPGRRLTAMTTPVAPSA